MKFPDLDAFQGVHKGDEIFDPVGWPLDLRQDRAVGAVLAEPGEVQPLGQLGDFLAEAHLLDPAQKGQAHPADGGGGKVREFGPADLPGYIAIPQGDGCLFDAHVVSSYEK